MGGRDRESFGALTTPKSMPHVESFDPVSDLLRAGSVKA